MRSDVFPLKAFLQGTGVMALWGSSLQYSVSISFSSPQRASWPPRPLPFNLSFLRAVYLPPAYLLVCLSDTMIKPRFMFPALTAIFLPLRASCKGHSCWNRIFLLSPAARRQALTLFPHSPKEQQEKLISFTLPSSNFYPINEITEKSHLTVAAC